MTKKQGMKKKVTVKVMPGEAVFVSNIETLEHIADTYSYMAQSCEDNQESEAWLEVASNIREWIASTYYSGQAEDFEEDWQ
jgi:hypothetical protein